MADRPRTPRSSSRGPSWPHLLGLLFIGLQGIAFLYAKFTPVRYFCWAPYDMHTSYAVEVSIGGRTLSQAEIAGRYRLPSQGFNPRSYHEVLGAIKQFEETYGRNDDATVRVLYSVNGNEEKLWRYPGNR